MPGTRRTAVKAVKSAAAEFDFDVFLSGFARPEFNASLIQRADLAPRLAVMVTALDELDESIDRMERAMGEDGPEQDITARNPLQVLTARRETLTLEYNEMAETYNNSAVHFTFRVPDQAGDHVRIQAMMDEIGLVQPETPDVEGLDKAAVAEINAAFEIEFQTWWDALAIRSMSVTCTSHPGTPMGAPPLTVEQWEALRERVGAAAFNSLGTAWFQAVQAAAPTAPFSQRPLPSRTTVTS